MVFVMEEKKIPLQARIAALVHAHFDSLPARYKPYTRNDGTKEWVPMSAFVVVQGQDTPSETLTCVALATGARCLAAFQVPKCNGLVLHDCHAEVLAMRALNYWLINECLSAVQHEQQGSPAQTLGKMPFVRRRADNKLPDACPPFEIYPDVKIYMYSTCAPCGDSSMELCMADQEDSTPWTVPPTNDETKDQPILLDGRGYFSILGVVRRKPSRADAERTLSKSCSDKLALRQVTSVLSYPASILIAPTSSAYITALILPEEEISQVGCARAFGGGATGRMKDLVGRDLPQTASSPETQPKYCFRPFGIMSVPMEIVKERWSFGKYRPDPANKTKQSSTGNKPSNVSAVWIASASSLKPYQVCASSWSSSYYSSSSHIEYKPRQCPESTAVLECIIGGIKQGSQLKAMTLRGASVLSRVKMWTLIHDILAQKVISGDDRWQGIIETSSYAEFKRGIPWLASRSLAMDEAKHVLSPWIPNCGDENWCREEVIALAQEKKKGKLK